MRVTHQMLHQNSMNNINQNLSRWEKTNNQVSTGKLHQRPSDDPFGVSKAMNLKSALQANKQYERNTNEATLWLNETDQTINSMVSVMQRARELAVQGDTGTQSEHGRTVIAAELEELTEQIRQFANTKVNGHYLFNGLNTNQAPFPNPDSYENNTFDTGSKTVLIGNGVSVKVNVTANQLFGNAEDAANLFKTMNDLADKIRSDESVPLEQFDKGMERILSVSAEVGARQNRVEAINNRIKDSTMELTSMLSKTEDVDYSIAITKLKSEESIYQASLAATAKLIQPSLLDFLR
jgi:flagellar hook-associated protein 3 FlgL